MKVVERLFTTSTARVSTIRHSVTESIQGLCRGFGWKWFDTLLDMMLIDRVGDFTHSVSAFCNYSISHQLIHDFIVYIEGANLS